MLGCPLSYLNELQVVLVATELTIWKTVLAAGRAQPLPVHPLHDHDLSGEHAIGIAWVGAASGWIQYNRWVRWGSVALYQQGVCKMSARLFWWLCTEDKSRV